MNTQIPRVLNLVAGPTSHWIGLHGMRIAIAIIFLGSAG